MSFLATSDTIWSALQTLAGSHTSTCRRRTLNHQATESGRDVRFLEIKPTAAAAGRPAAALLGGTHARELAPPAAIESFARKLVETYDDSSNPDIVYPAFSDGAVPYAAWTVHNADVRRIVDGVTILAVPVVNPDGRDFVIGPPAEPAWRGNRNTTDCPAFGVDINRNYSMGWQADVYYTPADQARVEADGTSPTCVDDAFRGRTAGSENETKNIQDLIDQEDVRFYVDVHMAGRFILTPWGLAGNQDVDPAQSFNNSALDRPAGPGRSVINGAYREFMPNVAPDRLLSTHRQVAEQMRVAILDQAGPNVTARTRSDYRVVQIPDLYRILSGSPQMIPVPGSGVDFAVSRQFRPGETGGTLGFGMEVGWRPTGAPGSDPETEGGWHPSSLVKYQKIEREIHAGLFALLTAAVGPAATGPALGKKARKKLRKGK